MMPHNANLSSAVVQVRDLGAVDKGGRLASRLVQDWLAGCLVQEKLHRAGPEDENGHAPTECPALRVFPPRPDAGTDHDLLLTPSQSHDEAHDPEGRGRSLLSCMCRYCRYHFVFHIDPPAHEETSAHLQHHFRVEEAEWHGSAEPERLQPSKQNPLQGRFRYACTLCGVTVRLEISLPRLQPMWIQMIVDENRIRESLRLARLHDPARYADTTTDKETSYLTGALTTLNQYLRNIIDDNGAGPRKRISWRNKTFLVQFGQECEPIFRYLGFDESHDQQNNESYWLPPRLPPQEGKTPVGSDRAFYEDARSEVQSLLDDKPPVTGLPVVKPISARDQLEKALGCDKSHRSVSSLPVKPDEAPYLATLGAPVDADDALLKFAYNRQVEADPDQTQSYLESLGTLSTRRSEELQMFVFTHQELVAKKQREMAGEPPVPDAVDKAYAHFGLTRSCPEAPAYFIHVYNAYREQSPAQKSDHRLALLEIGRDRNSQEIRSEVFGRPMELSEACQFLHVKPEWPMDSIAVTAQSVASELDVDQFELLLLALDTISAKRPADDPNRLDFEQIQTELRSSQQSHLISSRTGHVGPATDAQGADLSHQATGIVDVELPVGLANLRNTCYLNSILQYFYSVNAVRNLAVASDLPALEPTEANLRDILRIGGSSHNGNTTDQQGQSDLETGRAFVGHEFTRELGTLFRELDATGESAIPPRQRLANAALLRPEKLRPRSADVNDPAAGANNLEAPPLPPRGESSPVSGLPDVPMVEVEQCETASTGSSQTLVDQTDGKDTPASTVGDHGLDSGSENGGAMIVDSGPAEPPSTESPADRSTEGEAKMSKLTVEELAVELDKPNVGSDQMDVDEVMGNAIDHLRAAFKVSSSGNGDPESAPDPIEQAFFSTFIDNRKKLGEKEWNRTSRSDRWVTAYPAQSGTRDLYDALANSFDLEPLPGDLLSFTTIERPAPHFHVCIQRSDGVRKNANPITIPETLYLDRFMHTGDSDSPLFRGRKRKWDVMTRLNEMEESEAKRRSTSKAEPQAATVNRPSNPPAPEELTEEEIDGFLVIGGPHYPLPAASSSAPDVTNGQWHLDGADADAGMQQLSGNYDVLEPDTPEIDAGAATEPPTESGSSNNTAPTLPTSDLDGFWDKFVASEQGELARLAAERDSMFSDSRRVAYRLHAVVCHAGATASAGHYWVWIRDFGDDGRGDVWRKYNDTSVSVHPAEFVFGELNTKGEPYYLAYVRADEVAGLVSIPRRRPLPPQPTPEGPESEPMPLLPPPQSPPPVPPRPKSALDMVMVDAAAADDVVATVEYLEDVDMLPPPYAGP